MTTDEQVEPESLADGSLVYRHKAFDFFVPASVVKQFEEEFAMKPDELAGAIVPPVAEKVAPGTAKEAFQQWLSQAVQVSIAAADSDETWFEQCWQDAVKWCAARADQIAASFSEVGNLDRAYGARAVAKHLGGFQ